MISLTNNFIFFLIILLLNSCAINEATIKNPCRSNIFVKELASFPKSELIKLASSLDKSSYSHHKEEGCRLALLGQIYFAQQRMSLASEYFSLAQKKLPELSEYFLLAKAKAEQKNHNLLPASQLAKAILNSPLAHSSLQFALQVRRVLADIAMLEKDHHQIIKTHQDLLTKGYTENEVVLFNLASSLTAVGEHKKANDIYKKLLVTFPTSEGAKRAQQLRHLAEYSLDLKEREKHFDKLIEKLAFDQAVKHADQWLNQNNSSLDNETRGHINSLAIKALMLNNQFEAGLKRAKQTSLKKHVTSKELESYAWGLAKVDRYIDAAEIYGRLIEESSDKENKAKGCFFRGFSLYEASLYSMALFTWQACHSYIQNSTHYENYLWYQALAFMLSDNYNKALDYLQDLNKNFPKSIDSEKYTYFRAYALRQLNKINEAKAIFINLGHKKQPSYYVLLARKTLGLAAPKGVNVKPEALSQLAERTKDENSQKALLLFHLGFKEEARDLILSSTAAVADRLALLQHLGFYHEAWQRAHWVKPTITIEKNTLKVNSAIRSAFPMPHQTIVENISNKYDLKQSLLYAIIQAESGFLENATSYRGASGLMQMMPFVAKDLAAKLSISKWTDEHLKDPKIAIELGALLVATLERQFGQPHLILAAYNAGPHQVQKWLNRFGQLPEELFIERIPFKQTRDYIKKILPNESLYYAMNGKELKLSL